MASYRKLKTGWQYRISYKDPQGKFKEKTASGFPTKKAAKEVAEPLEQLLLKNPHRQEADTLFTEYYHQWAQTYKYGLFSIETDKTYQTAEKMVQKYFAGLSVRQITMDAYQAFINDYAKTRAKETVRKYHNKISACLKHAFYTGVIPTDVTYKITLTGKEGQRPEEKHISKKEMQVLLEALERDIKFTYVSRYMLLLQASTGARLGEIMAVTFDSIDFKAQTLKIDKSWDYKYTRDFKNTKNKVHRVVDLDDEIIQRLKPFYNYKRKQSLTGVIKNHKNLLFTDDKMETFSEKAVNKALANACGRAGIKRITSHALRHTHASILLLHGIDMQIVAERLGDSVEVVSTVYAHVLDEMRDKNRDEIKRISASLYA